MKSFSISNWLTVLCLASIAHVAQATVITAIDSFDILRNGAAFFTDPFTDGAEPPSAPNFPSGAPASYGVNGTFPSNAETGGKLQMNSALGGVFFNAPGVERRSQAAILLTNTDSSNTTAGLKRNHTFSVSGLFDLSAAAVPAARDNFGVVVQDRAVGLGIPGDEQLQVDVFRNPAGEVRVRFLRQDFAADSITVLGQQLVDFSLGEQILLSIIHPIADTDELIGRFQYFNAGAPVGSPTDLGTGTMFRGETWVRGNFFSAQEVVIARVSEPGSLALLGAAFAAFGLSRARKLTQTLIAG